MRTSHLRQKIMLPIESAIAYFQWLKGLVDDGRASNHPMLFEIAWNTDYSYSVPRDANRYMDGLDLRREFERETSVALPDLGPCKMLEFLVALSKRVDYILYDENVGTQYPYWFWLMMENLGIAESNNEHDIYAAFIVMMTRNYDYSGEGGLFPLIEPRNDQRKIEIWYQMHAWINELVRM